MKILDTYAAGTISDALLEVLDDLGFPPKEAIPGLIATVRRLANGDGRILDEAAELLDGGE